MSIDIDWLGDLKAAYEEAEDSAPRVGDTLILPNGSGGYIICPAVEADRGEYEAWDIRILKRAPKPKPVPQAVMAGYVADEHFDIDPAVRHVWANRGGDYWESIVDFTHADQLVDPVPLVELPSHEELARAFLQVGIDHEFKWPESDTLADAVLELLEGRA